MVTMKNKSTYIDEDEANIVMGELIGRDIQIIRCTQKSLIGIKGTIIDETLKILVVDTGEKELKVPKKDCVFRFKTDNREIDVDGKKLSYRPEDRIKKHWRKYNAGMR